MTRLVAFGLNRTFISEKFWADNTQLHIRIISLQETFILTDAKFVGHNGQSPDKIGEK